MHHKRRSRRRDKRTMASCGCCEIIAAAKEPIEDGPCTGFVKSKGDTPAKDRCPVNRTHEWYAEVVDRMYWGDFSVSYRVSTCIHCWAVKEKHVKSVDSWRSNPHRNLVLPKRAVKY